MVSVRHALACAAAGIAAASFTVGAHQAKPPAPGKPQASAAAGVYTDAQAARGEAVYAENCAQCHMPTLAGGELAPALTGAAFTARWTTARPLSEVFDYMRTQMPLNSPGGLTAQHNADLLAYLLKKSGYPAGQIDLSNTSAQLAGVKVTK